MVAEEFDPIDHAREPREEGWKEETEQIIEHIRNRGDLRIGQLIINAVSKDVDRPERPKRDKSVEEMTDEEAEEYMKELENHEYKCKAQLEQRIWSIEADRLLKLLDQFQDIEDE